MNPLDLLERAQRFLRVNGVWDMRYEDGRKLSQRLAEFMAETIVSNESQRHAVGSGAMIVSGLQYPLQRRNSEND